ncbi:hypothetical protein ORJ04_18400 [Rheinheimera baltica]|uniref:Uncharacterized protein n=1 Tax=Rheinheimera baltica TaxID=67576 RepID=A0ABT9I4Q9_9GAMM|nr:hypothetical protein [Rheinheimera baltica]MDP5137926.1 hypothetical protein [Rheinheimera baltica]MDP5149927.1 hypothetical protein [Rheinheimera baltica]
MLFNLAALIGLEAEHSAPAFPIVSPSDPATPNQQNNGLPTIRQNRQQITPEIISITEHAANDTGVPAHHYKGENLAFWMMPTQGADALRIKNGDSAWLEAKLRRVPISIRQSLAEEYSARYKAAYDAEPTENKKANKAAFIANSWLLIVTK